MGHDVVQKRVRRASDIPEINRVQINSCPFVSFHMIPYNIINSRARTERKRLQPNIYRNQMGFRKFQIKLYFATILDLEHQRTSLTTQWDAYFWKLTFRVVLRTGLWMLLPVILKQARAILNEPNTRDRTNHKNFSVDHSISSYSQEGIREKS